MAILAIFLPAILMGGAGAFVAIGMSKGSMKYGIIGFVLLAVYLVVAFVNLFTQHPTS